MTRGRVPDLRQLLDPAGRVPPDGLVFRPSVLSAVGSVLSTLSYVLFLGVLPLLAANLLEGDALLLVTVAIGTTGIAFLPLVFGLVATILRVAFTRYVLDQDGIHVRTQILQATEQRVPWEKVTSVTHHRTVFDSLLGVERMRIVSYGAQGTTLRLVGLRGADRLRELVGARMRQSASVESWLRLD